MKILKYGIAVVLISIGLVFTGELSLLYIDNFMNHYYSCNFYIDSSAKDVTSSEMMQDLLEKADKYKIDFFVISTTWDSSYQYNTTIAGTAGAINKLKESGIKAGLNKSFFFENQNVSFMTLTTDFDISQFKTFYFTGDKTDYSRICDFKASLIDKYGGGYPHECGSDKETLFNLASVWTALLFILLILNAYEVACAKKECIIRMVLGESIVRRFVITSGCDVIVYCFVFFVVKCVLNNYTNASFKASWVLWMFILFLIINTIIGSGILKLNYKKDLASGYNSKHLIPVAYAMNTIITVLMLLAFCLNYVVVNNAINLYVQRHVFESYPDSFYYSMWYPDAHYEENDSISDDERLYREMYELFQSKAYQYADLTGYYNITYPLVMVNKNSFSDICDNNETLNIIRNEVENNNVSLLFPKSIKIGSKHYNNALEMTNGVLLDSNEYGKWNITSYRGNVYVIGIHDTGLAPNYSKKMYKNPVILVNNSPFVKESKSGYDPYYNHDIFYNVPYDLWINAMPEQERERAVVYSKNVLEEYKQSWQSQKYLLQLTAAIMLIGAIIEILMISTVIHMDFKINAIERATQKVLGYSLFECNKRLILNLVISNIAGIIACIIIQLVAGIHVNIIILVSGCLIVIAVEIFSVLVLSVKAEKYNLNHIIKGERI